MKRLVATPLSDDSYHWAALSPSARMLAYARCARDTNFACDVHVVDIGPDLTVAGKPRQLSRHRASVYGLVWTADGTSIVYGSGESRRPYLWRVSAEGGQPERLEIAGDRAGSPAFSAATHSLAFTRWSAGPDIWKLTANAAPVTWSSSTLADLHAQYSPDGTQVAFESNRLGKDSQIWLARADGTSATPLTEGAEGVQGGSPRWSPDGRWIAFDRQGEDGRQAVYVVDAAGGRPRLLTNGHTPSWSRDGRTIYFSANRTGRYEVWRIPQQGGEEVQVSDIGGEYALLSPDGTTVYYRGPLRGAMSGELFARPVAGPPARLSIPWHLAFTNTFPLTTACTTSGPEIRAPQCTRSGFWISLRAHIACCTVWNRVPCQAACPYRRIATRFSSPARPCPPAAISC